MVAEWSNLCTIVASPERDDFELILADGADEELVGKLHRGLAEALVRHLRGGLTLHASAVQIGDGAIACLGMSGAGKSTLVASFVHTRDAALVSDDCLAIEFPAGRGPEVHSSDTAHWLLSDARRALNLAGASAALKAPIAPTRRANVPVPLRLIVVLSFDESLREPTIRPLRGHRLLERLLPNVVRFAIDDPARHRTEIEQLSRLVATIPTYELTRPRDLNGLEPVNALLVSTFDAHRES